MIFYSGVLCLVGRECAVRVACFTETNVMLTCTRSLRSQCCPMEYLLRIVCLPAVLPCMLCSGHACAWMMTVVAVTSFYPHGYIKYLVWLAYVQTSLRTAVEGWHYSVDFILPAVLCWYVWKDLAWVYPTSATIPLHRKDVQDPTSKVALLVVIGVVAFCVLVAFFVGG
jgi:hypothetical protein